jgi:hypothetical protein
MARQALAVDLSGKFTNPVTTFDDEFQNYARSVLFPTPQSEKLLSALIPPPDVTAAKQIAAQLKAILKLANSPDLPGPFGSIYCSLLMSYDLPGVSDRLLPVISQLSERKAYPAELLNVIIPLTHSIRNIDPDMMQDLSNMIIEKYSLSTFLIVFTDFLRAADFGSPQIRFLTELIKTSEPSPQDIKLVRETVQAIPRSSAAREIDALERELQIFTSSPASARTPTQTLPFDQGSHTSGNSMTSPARIKPSRAEMLSLLADVESKYQFDGRRLIVNSNIHFDDPLVMLQTLSVNFRKVGFPPDRPFEPVFAFAVDMGCSNEVYSRFCMDILKGIYQIPGKSQAVFDFFRFVSKDTGLNVEPVYLDAQYQNFRRAQKTLRDLPLTLGEFVPGDISGSIEQAFEWLTKWEMAFDGVKQLWAILKANPRVNFNSRFDTLYFSQKQFLIEGLRLANKEENDGDERLESRIADLEQRASMPRIDVDADVERVKARAETVTKSTTSPLLPRSPKESRVKGMRSSPAGDDEIVTFLKI